ncbi:MAG: F0F1 ATP synthase subunit A [Chloroflexaceae bacterium]|nr:F0F1 ATP synthase subunit A [Chloroflexaceae bacterium]
MSPGTRKWLIVGGVVLLVMIVSGFIPMSHPHVEIKAEPIFHITDTIPFTNSLLVTVLVDLFLIVLAFVIGRNLKLVPGAFQNIVEIAIDGLYKLFQGVNREYAPRVFPVVATIFFYLLFSNWFGLIPGFGAIGKCVPVSHETETHASLDARLASTSPLGLLPQSATLAAAEEGAEEGHSSGGCPAGYAMVPLLRSPSADLNFTFALALLVFVYIEYWGFSTLGVGYITKFFNTHGFKKGVLPGLMDLAVGLLEFISELARIIAFSFRLFGNIFAGEVLLLVMAFLVPVVLPMPFYGFEIFVGFIQAFVFAMLTMAFIAIAVIPHGGEHGEAAH